MPSGSRWMPSVIRRSEYAGDEGGDVVVGARSGTPRRRKLRSPGPADEPRPAVSDRFSSTWIIEPEFLKRAAALRVVAGPARGDEVGEGIGTTGRYRDNMIWALGEDPPQIVRGVPNRAEVNRKERLEIAGPYDGQGAVPAAPAVSLADLQSDNAADVAPRCEGAVFVSLLPVALPRLVTASRPVHATSLEIDRQQALTGTTDVACL